MDRPAHPRVAVGDPQGALNRRGDEEIALDVTSPPGEKLETRHARIGKPRLLRTVSIQNAEAGQAGIRAPRAVEMLDGPSGTAPSEDHGCAKQPAAHRWQQPIRPGPQDCAILGSLQIEDQSARGATGKLDPGLHSQRRCSPGDIGFASIRPHSADLVQANPGLFLAIFLQTPQSGVYVAAMISVLIADDHSVVREGVRHLIETEADINICGEASDGREVLEQIEKTKPDLVILDISMPRLSGLETLERIRTKYPGTKTILLSVHADPPMIQSAVALGVDGYVLKNARKSEILSAIRAVVRGGSYFSPTVAREIVAQIRDPRPATEQPFSVLSAREREVLHLIAEGLAAKEIATQLGISTKTVEAHRTSLMRKLGVRKATELVRYAVRHGLIEA